MAHKKLATKDNVKKVVELALCRFEKTRNDDKLLIYYVWFHYTWGRFPRTSDNSNLIITIEKICSLPNPETIIRIRAVIQNQDAKYLPTEIGVRQRRRISEVKWCEWVRKQESLF